MVVSSHVVVDYKGCRWDSIPGWPILKTVLLTSTYQYDQTG